MSPIINLFQPATSIHSKCGAQSGLLTIYVHKVYEGRLISNAHSEIFCRRTKVAMRAQCVLVATNLQHSGAKFHSFLYTHSKTVRVNMESCYGGMSTRLKQRAVSEDGDQFLFNIVTGDESWIHHFDPEEKRD